MGWVTWQADAFQPVRHDFLKKGYEVIEARWLDTVVHGSEFPGFLDVGILGGRGEDNGWQGFEVWM